MGRAIGGCAMLVPSHPDAFEVLCLQAADDGRGNTLFGDCLARARKEARPFMVGEEFPSVYLEFPLRGKPFLDVTALYDKLTAGTRVESNAAVGTGPLMDWFADASSKFDNISCGFELDVKDPSITQAAIHFQPRSHLELVEPFCASIGESRRVALYLDLAARMPQGWPLAFFGLFRGRAGSPLRVCGYLDEEEAQACVEDPGHIAAVFDQVGFEAYDDAMLARVSALLESAPKSVDFQFDVYDDGHIGETFAIDIQFGIEQPDDVRASFEDGPASRVLGMLERWGAADSRWRLAADAAFARSVDVDLGCGETGRYVFLLMPQWVKARWTAGDLQPAKLYHFAHAGLLQR